jgi:hypothetical protein
VILQNPAYFLSSHAGHLISQPGQKKRLNQMHTGQKELGYVDHCQYLFYQDLVRRNLALVNL